MAEDWKSWAFRQRVQQQLDELIRNSPSANQRNAQDLEAQVFQRAKTRDEYLQFIARIVMHMRGVANDNMNRGNNPNITAVLNSGPGGTQGQMPGGQFGGPGGNIVVLPPGMQQNHGPGPGGPRMQSNVNINMPNQGGVMNDWQNTRMSIPGKQENINMSMQGGGKMTQMPISISTQGGSSVNQVPPQIMNNMTRPNVGMPPGMATRVPSPGFPPGQTSTGPRPGPSPIGAGPGSAAPMTSNTNQPSPAFVSPSPSSTMVPSPVGMVNTPGPPGQHPLSAVPSASQNQSETERIYRAKVQQLSKYVEPLRRMIQRIQDAEKLSKMKKLFDMLQNPQRRMPLETLIKCETVLEKLEISREDGPVGPQVPPSMDSRIAALLEAVGNAVKTPCGAHSLNRTISPGLSVLLGPTLCPPPLKKIKKDPVVQTPPETPNISDIVQGEVARLNSRFRVNVDCQQPPGSDDLTLICQLDDPNLPCVPPITLIIPWDYPEKPPRCELQAVDYETTDFLCRIREVALVRLRNMPPHCSLTMLLHSWEMSVRQACSPKPLTDNPVLNSFALTG
ncbi:unnamed protein product, partial [Meganyctiphanes norvegica]